MPIVRPVILSGGAGTRLWPLSTTSSPKQFAELVPGGSLFAQTFMRLKGVPDVSPAVIVTGAAHAGKARSAAEQVGMSPGLTIVEPVGRNTAPAALAAAFASEPSDVLVILPSDHLVTDTAGFQSALVDAVDHAADGSLVTFGISPIRPETGYGYIELGKPLGRGYRMSAFVEKPGDEAARGLSTDGRHLWNSGIFVVMAAALIEEAEIHCPEIAAGVLRAMRRPVAGVLRLAEGFAEVEGVSLDYAIMEKTERALVMPIDVGWSDLGSYEALWEASPRDEEGNVTVGDVVLADVSGSMVRADSRKVAVVGVEDIVVIETEEAVLVVPRDRAQEVGDLDLGLGSS